jgi:hypothetical protein
LRRFFRFLTEVYSPALHLAFAAGWFVALERLLRMTADPAALPSGAFGAPSAPMAGARWLTLLVLDGFVALFFLRIVDEWKDEAYDRVHHPSRPLPRGLVTHRDLAIYLAGAGALALALAACLGRLELAIVAVDLAWGLALVVLERVSVRVREGMLLNLAVTFPVNVGLGILVYASLLREAGSAPTARGALAVASFALAFLHFEVLRKTAWPAAAAPGERLYSRVLGPRTSVVLATGLALAALGIAASLALATKPASSLALLAPALAMPLLSFARFVRHAGERVKLRPLGMAFLALFYAGVASLSLVGGSSG